MNIFSPDGKIYTCLSMFCNLVALNLLWILFSLPIFTVGASTTALYTVTLQLANHSDIPVAKTFAYAFRKNFRQATIVFLIVVLFALLLAMDLIICNRYFSKNHLGFLLIPLLTMLFILLAINNYLYAVIAYFKNSMRKVFTNSFRLALGHFPTTLSLVFLSLGPVLFLNLCSGNPALGSFLCLILGMSLFTWLKSFLLLRIFSRYSTTS